MFESVNNMIGLTVSIAAFLGIMAEVVIIQQKSVDCVKIMNPEKTASVYDMKFQKKWLETCDEAEKIIVGKCAFKAFNITNSMCSVLGSYSCNQCTYVWNWFSPFICCVSYLDS